MCNEAVRIKPYLLEFVPDHLKNWEMYNEAMQMKPAPFFLFFFLWCKSKREDGIRTLIPTMVNSLFRGVIVMNNARYKKER